MCWSACKGSDVSLLNPIPTLNFEKHFQRVAKENIHRFNLFGGCSPFYAAHSFHAFHDLFTFKLLRNVLVTSSFCNNQAPWWYITMRLKFCIGGLIWSQHCQCLWSFSQHRTCEQTHARLCRCSVTWRHLSDSGICSGDHYFRIAYGMKHLLTKGRTCDHEWWCLSLSFMVIFIAQFPSSPAWFCVLCCFVCNFLLSFVYLCEATSENRHCWLVLATSLVTCCIGAWNMFTKEKVIVKVQIWK